MTKNEDIIENNIFLILRTSFGAIRSRSLKAGFSTERDDVNN